MFHEGFLAVNQERNREAALLNFIQTLATKEGIGIARFFSQIFALCCAKNPVIGLVATIRRARCTAKSCRAAGSGAPSGIGLRAPGSFGRFYTDQAHHSVVFVLQKVAVVDKITDDFGIAKIQPHSNGGVDKCFPVIVGNVDSISEKRLVDLSSEVIE